MFLKVWKLMAVAGKVAACLVALAVCGSVNAGISEVQHNQCAGRVFSKSQAGITWAVSECDDAKGNSEILISFTEHGNKAKKVKIFEAATGSVLSTRYELLSPSTLLIDMAEERGGRAILLHPIKKRDALSAVRFTYMTDDEDTLKVRMSENKIYAESSFVGHQFVIDSTGRLIASPRNSNEN
jgi:hypothetical protein